ncbi:ribosome silencing factor [Liquorilactobacillus vini]|uniref:Ribosomal silencing factor RsfS n=1 Tax=Liquorilactobacillus vini DSM 20605 TaxID=1133569 RepID=A0A0R2CDF3_9LACO|nr:ribosome silencing factor [Liquorilactobacillus vini]KRM89789.1 Iojap family protein [Liquorilactobacillus vini DSM 20605]
MKNSNLLKVIVNAADDKRAEELVALDIHQVSSITDCFVIMQADSKRQVQAIAEEIEEKVAAAGFEIQRIDGRNSGTWVLIDLGDIIVHVFQTETRKFYNLEKLWSNCPSIDLHSLINE